MKDEELFANLEREMEVMPCESPRHSSSALHEGPGLWYVTMICPRCSYKYDSLLACDRYKSFLPILTIMSGTNVVECRECREQFLYRDTIIVSEKRIP